MVKRFYDKPDDTFSYRTDMLVVCPKCGRTGMVHFDEKEHTAFFQCDSCYTKKETASNGDIDFEVISQCTSTGRYFRTSVPQNKIHGQKVWVKCPYCKESVIGNVSDKKAYKPVFFEDTYLATDPYFHLPLYFQASFRGKLIWAWNREHLQYLIDYLSADIRTVQHDFYETYKTMRSQSDMLPAFMKTAKNRKGIVRLLVKLQEK